MKACWRSPGPTRRPSPSSPAKGGVSRVRGKSRAAAYDKDGERSLLSLHPNTLGRGGATMAARRGEHGQAIRSRSVAKLINNLTISILPQAHDQRENGDRQATDQSC